MEALRDALGSTMGLALPVSAETIWAGLPEAFVPAWPRRAGSHASLSASAVARLPDTPVLIVRRALRLSTVQHGSGRLNAGPRTLQVRQPILPLMAERDQRWSKDHVMAEQRTAYMHSPAPGNSRVYMGSILTIPVRGESTLGRLAVMEAKGRPGNEPPPHVHEWEDELFYLLEGSAEFYCGKECFVAGAGDYVLIPQGIPHTMRFLTPAVRVIAVFSAVGEHPVEADRYLLAMSKPATSLDLPAAGTATTYATGADPAHTVRLAAEHGARFLTPDETRELLPGYPGFGVHRR